MSAINEQAKLETVDEQHFFFDEVLIDIPQLWYHDSKNPRPWGQGHAIVAALSHLQAVAYNLHRGIEVQDLFRTVRAIEILKRNGFKI